MPVNTKNRQKIRRTLFTAQTLQSELMITHRTLGDCLINVSWNNTSRDHRKWSKKIILTTRVCGDEKISFWALPNRKRLCVYILFFSVRDEKIFEQRHEWNQTSSMTSHKKMQLAAKRLWSEPHLNLNSLRILITEHCVMVLTFTPSTLKEEITKTSRFIALSGGRILFACALSSILSSKLFLYHFSEILIRFFRQQPSLSAALSTWGKTASKSSDKEALITTLAARLSSLQRFLVHNENVLIVKSLNFSLGFFRGRDQLGMIITLFRDIFSVNHFLLALTL